MNYTNVICEDIFTPLRGSDEAAGYDLKAAHDFVLNAGQSKLIGTGVKLELPKGYYAMLVPRSSLGKKGLTLANTLGIIDSDYQGEIMMFLKNNTNETYLGYRLDRMCQIIIMKHEAPKLVRVSEFKQKSERADGGFGSTGG